jgi:hypothetical protein
MAVSCGPGAAVGCAECGCGTGPAVTTMSYVGGGMGDYKEETTYRYVGFGAGEFGVMNVPLARPNYCLCICVPLLLLLLLCPFLYFLLSASSPHVIHHHCFQGDPLTWGPVRRAWCCHHVGRGCPTTRPPPPPPMPTIPPPPPPKPITTTHCPFDCTAGYDDLGPHQWVKGWSAAKKVYCCKTAHRGCPSELPPPSGEPPSGEPPLPDTFKYDCNAGYHNCYHCLQLQWSPAKMSFCCKTENKGCKGTTKP